MADHDPYLPIGLFAALTGLSHKALRLYADNGILTPAHINSDTGYRFYAPSQVELGKAVQGLRDINMPLVEIRTFCEFHATSRLCAADYLKGYWHRQRQNFEQRERRAHQCLNHLVCAPEEPLVIATRRIEEQLTLVSCGVYNASELKQALLEHQTKLLERVRDQGISPKADPFCCFPEPVTKLTASRVEFHLPVPTLVEPGNEEMLKRWPAHWSAHVRVSTDPEADPYPHILSALEWLLDWLLKEKRHMQDWAPRLRLFERNQDQYFELDWPCLEG